MISLYKILTDKYGKYFISNGKKRRLKTIEKKYEQVFDRLQHCDNEEDYNRIMLYDYFKYEIVMINDTEYIQFG